MEEKTKEYKTHVLAAKFHPETIVVLKEWREFIRQKYGFGAITWRLERLIIEDLQKLKNGYEPELIPNNLGSA